MPELTEFQKKRQENIKRNNDLLKKLHLSGVASQIKHEAGVSNKARVPAKKKQRTSSSRAIKSASPTLPTRRSRRLRGEAADNTKGIPNVNDNQLLKKDSPNGEDKNFIDEMKEKSVIGDVKLSDLIKDEDEDALLEKFKRFNNSNFSSGDFFEEIKKRQGDVLGMDEFDLDLYDVFQPNEIKVTYDRISATYFHPAVEKKLVIAGDTGGTVGFWNVRDEPLGDSEEDRMEEPDITRVKLFTKNVGRIDCFPTNTSKVLLTSYDGSVRSVHLNNLQSEEMLTLKNEYDDPLGISDCQFSYENPHILFLTTLSGEFTTFDTRAKNSECKLRRLADKKIGSMAINPLRPYEIATGSLDRTLKIWDTRHLVEKPEWSQYEDYPSHDLMSTYDSRLSVSAVSYSPTDGTLVCNGYDDTIRLFDLKNKDSITAELVPKLTIQHNCQTGRWTSILKARFKPNKSVFAIANMKRAIDIYNSEGQQLAHLHTATVPAVVSWHPLQNWIVGGNSSGKIFLFTDDSQAIKLEE